MESLPAELEKSKVYENERELWKDLEKYDLTNLQIVRNDEGYAVWREIPTELERNKVYQDERELWEDLEKYDLTDLQIVRNDEGYAVWREMPGKIHNAAVRQIQIPFTTWESEQAAVLFGEKDADVFVSNSYQGNMKRVPDFAIWGPERLCERGGPSYIDETPVTPHVIFQYSWGNKFENEKHAVDDMTMFAGVGKDEALLRPNVVYLIKAKRKGNPSPRGGAPVHGFDVYEVRAGDRVPDLPTLTYTVGGDEDVSIEVDPVDMGLPSGATPLTIPLAQIRIASEKCGVRFEMQNRE
jgi:hypothetical protein